LDLLDLDLDFDLVFLLDLLTGNGNNMVERVDIFHQQELNILSPDDTVSDA